MLRGFSTKYVEENKDEYSKIKRNVLTNYSEESKYEDTKNEEIIFEEVYIS